MNWNEIVALVKSLVCGVSELWRIIWKDITGDMRDWFKYSVGLLITTVICVITLVIFVITLIFLPLLLAILVPTIILESFFIKLGGVKDKVFSSVKWLFYKK